MKKIFILVVLMLFVASAAFAVISGSKHDIRTSATAKDGGYNEICVYCHTPHGASKVAGYGDALPLWNRSIPADTAYSPYNNPNGTLNAAVDNAIGAQSVACMSCHDGTLAMDALVNAPNSGSITGFNGNFTVKNLTGGNAALTADLSDDHPVGFTYPADAVDTGLNARASLGTGVRLFGGTYQVECASCHNVHEPGTTALGTTPFLKSTNAGSALCLVCHNK